MNTAVMLTFLPPIARELIRHIAPGSVRCVPYANLKVRALYYRAIDKTPARRETKRLASLAWKYSNIEYARAMDRWRFAVKRMAGKLHWMDQEAIKDIYMLAATAEKLFGKPYEVDHIVPVKHPLVCGLHVPWNLQIICRTENRRKHNSHWPGMPEALPTALPASVSRGTRKSRAKSTT